MAGDEALRRKMGENGRQVAKEQFDWNTIAKQIIALYDEITRGNNTTRVREAVGSR
jgi:glycosyltransferase involved in cell wall biosynthesis